MEWDYILYYVLILSTSHGIWCPHSCMTAQKVPYPAPLSPQIRAGALSSIIFFLGISKSHSLTYLKWKVESSDI